MLIYGVCEESITKYNEDKAEKFLKNLLDTSCKDIAENYFINKEENGCNLHDWLIIMNLVMDVMGCLLVYQK